VDLSVIMPVYNERETILAAIDEVLQTEFPVTSRELIVVDDGSTDGTAAELRGRGESDELRILECPSNRGKGAAMRAGVEIARGDIVALFDADLEYDPGDIAIMLPQLADEHIDAVFGTRMWQAHSAYSYWYVVGNRIINTSANVLYNAWLSDCCAGTKVMPRELFRSLALREDGFAIEAEMTGRLLRRGARIYEVPITYKARGREQGKKIYARDGMRILMTLLRCRIR
jgi:glycosyltransferase involved in cell wall biosynthesis